MLFPATRSYAQLPASPPAFEDGFDDGDLTAGPAWSGDRPDFTISTEGSNPLLKLDAQGSGTSYLSAAPAGSAGRWTFYIEFRDFEPSGSNRAEIFLMSDTADLTGPVSGYAVRAGESGDDVFRLVRYDNGSTAATVLTDTTVIRPGGYTVRVNRSANGQWRMAVGRGYGAPLHEAGSAVVDSVHTTASHFGLRVDYTSTRADRFYFDFRIDLPPFVMSGARLHHDSVTVSFNRPYDPGSVRAGAFTIAPDIGIPTAVHYSSASTLSLHFSPSVAFPTDRYRVTASGISDHSGNSLADSTALFTVFGEAGSGEVLISEFMYDPPAGQPEYVELYNASGKYLDLRDWQLADAAGSALITADSVTLAPGGLLVITPDTVGLSGVYGPRPWLQATSLPALNNGGDVLQLISGRGKTIDSLQYTPGWGGDRAALERRSYEAPSTWPENFSESPDPRGGTPGRPNTVSPDRTPPSLRALTLMDSTGIALTYSERMPDSTAGVSSNYQLDGSSAVHSVQRPRPDQAQLLLTTPLKNNVRYTLSITGQHDLFGNAAARIDTSFRYYRISKADSGEVFINEFMYDPPAGSSEYIELYNPTNQSFNLRNWSLNDATGTRHPITTERTVLPPGGFVVLAPDSTVFAQNNAMQLIVLNSAFPSLNNSGDSIVVRNGAGLRLDWLQYEPGWGGAERAVERHSTQTASFAANFAASPNPAGTPGKINLVQPDRTPPRLSEFEVRDPNTLRFVFDEPLDRSSAVNPVHYQLTGGINPQGIQWADTSVVLTLDAPLLNNTSYTVHLRDIRDRFGNPLPATDTSFTYYVLSQPDPDDVVINEFMYEPPDGSSEYIELYNTSDKSLDLRGWQLRDGAGPEAVITPHQHVLPPRSYVVVAPDSLLHAAFPGIDLIAMGHRFPVLNNAGDAIIVRDSAGTLLDSLRYDAGWSADTTALERRSTLIPPLSPNFGAAPSGFGTPGGANDILADRTPPRPTFVQATDSTTIHLVYDEFPEQGSGLDAANYGLSGGRTDFRVSLAASDTFRLQLRSPLRNAQDVTLSINGVEDLFGNALAGYDTTFTYYKISTADSGDIFITEFRPAPPGGQPEYIELFNATSRTFDLDGWTVSDGTGNPQVIATFPLLLPPGHYLAIAPDSSLQSADPDIEAAVMGSRFPNLNNNGDDIVIRRADGRRIDSLRYTARWVSGQAALQRRTTAHLPVRSNFGAGVTPAGTPGQPNRISPDGLPPRLRSLTVMGSRMFELVFDEPLDTTRLTITGRFRLNAGTPIVPFILSTDTLRLQLADAMQDSRQYTLHVEGVRDIFGNASGSLDSTFTYYEPSPPEAGDIFINEFQPDPPEGSTEYIELYNSSRKSLDLQHWSISDNTAHRKAITTGSHILPPGSYIVLAPDPTLRSAHPEINLLPMGPRFPSLNNSGDAIVVRDSAGILLDSLQYTRRWVTGPHALERRTTTVPPVEANFGTPPDSAGSPGAANTIPADQKPPTLTGLNIAAPTRLELLYDEPLRPATAAPGKSYELSGGVAISRIEMNEQTRIVLYLADSLVSEQQYRLSIPQQPDLFGNTAPAADTSFTYYQPRPPAPGDVVINEFGFKSLDSAAEYIELYNASGKTLDLRGWTLADAGGNPNAITYRQQILPSRQYVVLTADSAAFPRLQPNQIIDMGSRFPTLNDGGDAIVLHDSAGMLLDSLRYSAAWAGKSGVLERRSVDHSSIQANFGPSPDSLGSPGSPNRIPPDRQPPALHRLSIADSVSIELIFTEATRTPEDPVRLHPPLSVTETRKPNPRTLRLLLAEPLHDGASYRLTAEPVKDIFDNTSAPLDTTFRYYQPRPADPADIYISEFHFHPPEDQSEYIELYNAGNRSVDLRGWSLQDDGGPAEIISRTPLVLPAGAFVVLAPDQSLFNRLPDIILAVMGSRFPSLNNGGDAIIVSDSTGRLLDSLHYHPSWGVPGQPLERRSAEVAAVRPNFAAPGPAGSPGSANTVRPDTIAPAPGHLRVIDSTHVQLSFAEWLDPHNLSDPGNYTVDGRPIIGSVRLPDPSTILLTLTEPLQSGRRYHVTAHTIRDYFGNTTQQASTAATYIKIVDADSGQVFISEFNFDPDDGATEYIELHNATPHTFDVQGWTLSDNTATERIITKNSFRLPAGSYLAVAPDSTLISLHPGLPLLTMGRQFPTLNNQGDGIVLRDAEGQILDSLHYTSAWAVRRAALERRSVEAAPLQPNFGHPTHGQGSPGAANTVPPDTTAPRLRELSITDAQSLHVTFDEFVRWSCAPATCRASLTGISVDTVVPTTDNRSFLLSLTDSLMNNTSYTLHLEGIRDLFGNTGAADSAFRYYHLSEARRGEVVINEFHKNPEDGTGEYIELHNPGNRSFDLNGWTLNDNTGHRRLITRHPVILPPRGFVVMAPDSLLSQSDLDIRLITMGNRFPALNNTGDDIVIRSKDGRLIDSLRYDAGWGTGGLPLERRSTGRHIPSWSSNFGISPDSTGSPGRANSIGPDTTAPVIRTMAVSADSLLLSYSEALDSAAVQAASYRLDGGLAISRASLISPRRLSLHFSRTLNDAETCRLSLSRLTDIFANAAPAADTTFTFYDPVPADSGRIFINEFFFDPPDGQTEYIELANPTTRSLNLAGWTLNDRGGDRRRLTTSPHIVPPDSFVVLSPDSSLFINRPAVNGLVIGPRFPTLNNAGDRIVLRDAAGLTLDSLQYHGAWTDRRLPLERRSTAIAPVQPNFGVAGTGSPGRANTVAPDTTAPRLQTLAVADSVSVELVFSEPLMPAADESYQLKPRITITHTEYAVPDTVRLQTAAPLENNTTYRLQAERIRDIFGNSSPLDTTFTYHHIEPADSGDIFISEFSYDPQEGQTEYIEIYNNSDKSVDLRGWTISDNTGHRRRITDNVFVLAPQGFVVLAPDQTLKSADPDMPLLPLGSQFPSLNNSGDDIVLRSGAGLLLDSLRYTAGWGGRRRLLERRSYATPPLQPNFGVPGSGSGSPGGPNTITADRSPPALLGIQVTDVRTLALHFSEQLAPAVGVEPRRHFRLQPVRNIARAKARGDTLWLQLEDPLVSEQRYTLTIGGAADIFGNTMADTAAILRYIAFSEPARNSVIINEILYRGLAGTMPEFIELYNPTDQNYDLSGWVIGDAGQQVSLPRSVWIGSRDYLVLTGKAAFPDTDIPAVYLSSFPPLNRSGDAVYLHDPAGGTIDSLFYGPSFGGTKMGVSAERIDPLGASNDPSNFRSSTAPGGSSPGRRNTRYHPDEAPPKLRYARFTDAQHIEVQFDEFITLTGDLRFWANDRALSVSQFNPEKANRILLRLPADKSGGNRTRTTLRVENLRDVKGNTTLAWEGEVAHLVQPGDVLINEIMYDPLADADDHHPDQTEYVELYNQRPYAVSLEGLFLHDAPDEKGGTQKLQPVTTTGKSIPGQGYALIYADPAASFPDSKTARYFALSDASGAHLLRVDRNSLGLSASDDAVYISRSDSVTLDSVRYRESWHNPNLPATDGIALERINPGSPSDGPANWGSSTAEQGGTPLQENSIYQVPAEDGSREPGIGLSPNPFSPDDDGYEDRLFIQYQLERADYLITVHIYDRYGRLVRELADSRPAGFEGELIWDGLRDDGSRNRIGIYIVVLKAFDSTGGARKAFKKAVVLARRFD